MTPRILLVEDDPVSREVIAALLVSRGHEVDVADDGFSALRMAQDTRYDLVFIDYHLPEMDGYALARLMRSLGEKTNATMKMVAITADQFGLAARRGVDSIFDRMVAKPIAPEALFAFVDEFLGPVAPLDAIESFLAPDPVIEEEHSPGLMLWRARGLAAMPKAAVFPTPSPSEAASLGHCFRLVEPDRADCLILLHSGGLPAIESVRTQGAAYLQPLFVVDPKLATLADMLFEAGSADSWTAAARLLQSFELRRKTLRPDVASTTECELRLAAYLFVAERDLELHRSPNGQTGVPYGAGFPATALIDAIRQLAGRNLVAVKPGPAAADGVPRLLVTLTANCVASLSNEAAA